jgi:hypothetical protein
MSGTRLWIAGRRPTDAFVLNTVAGPGGGATDEDWNRQGVWENDAARGEGILSKRNRDVAEANHGWDSLFPEFRDTQPRVIRTELGRFLAGASVEQVRAWDDSIPLLQREVGELCLRVISDQLVHGGYRLLLTRDLDLAKEYLRDRYSDAPEARHGLLASSKDRDLAALGIPNDWAGSRLMNRAPGPWFCEGGEHPRSCRRLSEVATEFQAQGLELDAALVAWGTDLVRNGGVWSNASARGYKRGVQVRDPFQLRVNAYRVLLTRARDVSVMLVPPLPALDETFEHLSACGVRPLEAA